MWDISSPIVVKGKHWGGFRIGYSLIKTEEAKAKLATSLFMIMGVILLISIAFVFFMTNQALKPLTTLTTVASRFADGDVEEAITFKSGDELGKLADVLERLRVSLKAAMDRLAR